MKTQSEYLAWAITYYEKVKDVGATLNPDATTKELKGAANGYWYNMREVYSALKNAKLGVRHLDPSGRRNETEIIRELEAIRIRAKDDSYDAADLRTLGQLELLEAKRRQPSNQKQNITIDAGSLAGLDARGRLQFRRASRILPNARIG